MRFTILTFILLFDLVLTAQEKVTVPVIDFGKDLPEKVLKLDEVADIKFVPLQTTDESLIKSINGVSMNSSRIIVTDKMQHQIFVFDNNGKFLNKISKRGNGPEDYQSITQACVDFDADRVYIWDYAVLGRIKVYSLDGKYIKQINVGNLPWPDQMYVYDKSHILIYCDPNCLSKKKVGKTPYLLVNTNTGKITPLNIPVERPLSNRYIRYSGDGMASTISQMDIYPLMRIGNKVVISDFSLPIVYMIDGGKLKPIAKRTKSGILTNDDRRMTALQNLSDRFMVFRSIMAKNDKLHGKIETTEPQTIIYDRKNNSIHNSDQYSEALNRSVMIESWNNDLPQNTAISVIPKLLLDRLHEKGKMSKELEMLYSSLDEDANDILMIVNFK